MVAAQRCQAASEVEAGMHFGHNGLSGRSVVTIMDSKRTVVGVCEYCHQAIIAQEPEYNTVLAPVRPHHRTVAKALWQCPETGIDHMAAFHMSDNGYQFMCVDCDLPLTSHIWEDTLTGSQYDVFLHEYVIEEEPV